MRQDWARYKRMIHHEQLRYELLRNSATRYDAQTGTSDAYLRSAFQNIEQVLEELSILQRKYMLHLNPGDPGLGLPFIRFLLKWSFNTGGKKLCWIHMYFFATCCSDPNSNILVYCSVSLRGPRFGWFNRNIKERNIKFKIKGIERNRKNRIETKK